MSGIWNHFFKISTSSGEKVKCKYCNYSGVSAHGTSNMRRHMNGTHSSIMKNDQQCATGSATSTSSNTEEPPEKRHHEDTVTVRNFTQPSVADFAVKATTAKKQSEKITMAITRYFAASMMPLSEVDTPAFRKFMADVAPGFEVPGRNAIKRRIFSSYEKLKSELQTSLKQLGVNCKGSVTLDGWSSCAQDHYITVTLHFLQDWKMQSFNIGTQELTKQTSEDIRVTLQDMLAEIDITNVFCAVTDNGKNFVKAVTEAGHSGFVSNSIPCAAHTLQLCLNEGLKLRAVSEIIAKCSHIVGHFKHSCISKAALLDAQNTDRPKSVVQYCRTRWTTCHKMLERLITLRVELTAVVGNPCHTKRASMHTLTLSPEEWSTIEAIAPILQQVTYVTALLEGDKYCSSSLVIPAMKNIVKKYDTMHSECQIARDLRNTIRDAIETRFDLNKLQCTPNVLDVATFLDPRYKVIERTPGVIDLVKTQLREKIGAAHSNIDDDVNNIRKHDWMDSMFDDEQKDEVEAYAAEPRQARQMCPLAWWGLARDRYPKLSRLAETYLAIPATSAPAERAFSKAGNIIEAKRAALKPATVKALCFLHEYYAKQ